MPSKIKSDLKSESAQDAEHPVVRGSTKSGTSRANGAKSHGPVTPEGRAKSSRNSIRHGLRAKSIVLSTESKEEFQSLLDSYDDQFDPQTGVEMELVEAMAVARWRLRRICTIETTLLGNEMVRRAEYIEKEFREMDQDPDNDDRLAYVFKRLADNGQTLALLVRYEGALNRSYDKAFKQLHILQSARNRPRPNEPRPEPTPAPASVTDAQISPHPASNADHRAARDSKRMPGIVTPSPDVPSPDVPGGLASPKPPIYT